MYYLTVTYQLHRLRCPVFLQTSPMALKYFFIAWAITWTRSFACSIDVACWVGVYKIWVMTKKPIETCPPANFAHGSEGSSIHIYSYFTSGLGAGVAQRYSAGLRAGWLGVLVTAGAGKFSLHHRVLTGSGARPVSYPMGTRGSFPEGKADGSWSWPLTSI
jgi:hypothetical protein